MNRGGLALLSLLTGAVAAMALTALLTEGTVVVFISAAVGIAAGPVALVARRRRLITKREMVCLTMFGTCNAIATILRDVTDNNPNFKFWGELAAMFSALMIMGAVGLIAVRRRGQDFWGVAADGGIVAVGSWLLAWIVLLRPGLDRYGTHPWLAGAHSALAPLGAIVLFLLVMIISADTERTRAMRYMTAAIVLALLNGLLRLLHDSGRTSVDLRNGWTIAAILAHLALFAGVLHPSVAALSGPAQRSLNVPMWGRVATTTAALVLPIVVLAATSPDGMVDLVVRTTSVGVLAVFVAVRILSAVRASRAAQRALLHAALTDSLTGLPNRSGLLATISEALSESWKGSARPTLFFIDLDRFKNINDSLGHAAGDTVLRTSADRLRSVVPDRATVARISGDEYVVFDPAPTGLEQSMELAQQLLVALREPIALTSGDVFVTASIGVAGLDSQSHRNADLLLRHADTAMYRAKDGGRNCVALFDESMHERVAHRLTVETALFRALDRRELQLYYQPILNVSTCQVGGFEALMRWRQADGTVVSPTEFIPIAEETGTIQAIGAWALMEATTQLQTWIDDGICSPLATMSVNVSPRQLAAVEFPAVVEDALARSGLAAEQLWLEVTEGMMISEPELSFATLRRLRSIGIRVALDDFGTGYSSLSLLRKFPLQRIKIDRAFVNGVADNAHDRSLVRTIIAMGSSLGLDMVAEGVETVQQLKVLAELGCMKAQGYLISHPLPPDGMRSTVAALERIKQWPGVPSVTAELQPVEQLEIQRASIGAL